MFTLMDTAAQHAAIKVIGVGGGGGNAVDHMAQSGVEGVQFINVNTDAQALQGSSVGSLLQLGTGLTKGLGAGANPEVGRQSAMDDWDSIAEMLDGTDMLFLAAGMGGGTGTGAAPVIAQVAREKGILTVAVVTRPFAVEGAKRTRVAVQGIKDLKAQVDSLITIPNDRVLQTMGSGTHMKDAFAAVNEVLLNAVQGISELITRPGMINVDFADVRAVMAEMGDAVMGSATAAGEDRAGEAITNAIASPLLDDISIGGARGVLVNITASDAFGMGEYAEIGDRVNDQVSEDATVIFGVALDNRMEDRLRVTIIATGIQSASTVPALAESQVPPTDGNGGGGGGQPRQLPALTAVNGKTNYALLDEPTALRRKAPPPEQNSAAPGNGRRPPPNPPLRGTKVAVAGGQEIDLDDLTDLPFFLRNQAD
ncbi:MAG: cell division protein FtsZ [Gammaproteobacteria bacterium]|nr:cell division protein FtsZ [Gammaproteobacteria bacterium]